MLMKPPEDMHIRLIPVEVRLPYGGSTVIELLEDATLRDLQNTIWKV